MSDKVTIIRSIETNEAMHHLRSDGIIHTQAKANYDITLEEAKSMLAAYIDLCEGKPRPHLIESPKLAVPKKEVLQFLAEEANHHGKADAYMVQSMAQNIMMNFFMKFHKPIVPTKFFKKEKDAVHWLKHFL